MGRNDAARGNHRCVRLQVTGAVLFEVIGARRQGARGGGGMSDDPITDKDWDSMVDAINTDYKMARERKFEVW